MQEIEGSTPAPQTVAHGRAPPARPEPPQVVENRAGLLGYVRELPFPLTPGGGTG